MPLSHIDVRQFFFVLFASRINLLSACSWMITQDEKKPLD